MSSVMQKTAGGGGDEYTLPPPTDTHTQLGQRATHTLTHRLKKKDSTAIKLSFPFLPHALSLVFSLSPSLTFFFPQPPHPPTTSLSLTHTTQTQ